MTIDKAGKIKVDRDLDCLIVDGVRVSMGLLVSFVNPDPARFFSMRREDDAVLVTQYTTDALREALARMEISA